jgi:hypothetical protein
MLRAITAILLRNANFFNVREAREIVVGRYSDRFGPLGPNELYH